MSVATSEPAAGLEERLRRRERELRAVYDITSALHRRTSLDELERQTLATAIETVDASAGSILLYDPKKEALVFRYVENPDPAVTEMLMKLELQPGQGIAGGVFQEGRGKITDDPSADKRFQREVAAQTQYRTPTMVTVPLKTTDGQAIGVMQILDKKVGDFDEADLELLEILGIHAASAIETARLREEAAKAVIVNLIGDISHDVKNLLTPVVAGTQTLELMITSMFEGLDAALVDARSAPDLAQRVREASDDVRAFYPEAVEMTYEGGQNVQERVREIADAIKGIVSAPHFELAHVNEVIEAVAKPLRSLAEKHEITLDLSGVGETPHVEIDKKRLYNALYNLINNAIPETPAGGRISVRVNVVNEEETPFLEVTVRDTGRGIPDDVLKTLFTDNAKSTKVGGTGLGTRIVRNVVEAHHGTIRVESQVGEGTAFIVRIPFRQPAGGNGNLP